MRTLCGIEHPALRQAYRVRQPSPLRPDCTAGAYMAVIQTAPAMTIPEPLGPWSAPPPNATDARSEGAGAPTSRRAERTALPVSEDRLQTYRPRLHERVCDSVQTPPWHNAQCAGQPTVNGSVQRGYGSYAYGLPRNHQQTRTEPFGRRRPGRNAFTDPPGVRMAATLTLPG